MSNAAKAMGLYVERVKVSEAYPRNGNVHNPTPRYSFLARKDATPAGILGTYQKHADAVDLCNMYAEDPK